MMYVFKTFVSSLSGHAYYEFTCLYTPVSADTVTTFSVRAELLSKGTENHEENLLLTERQSSDTQEEYCVLEERKKLQDPYKQG